MNKIEENIDITFRDMCDYFDNTFTSHELQFTELSVLKKMNYILIDNENEFMDEVLGYKKDNIYHKLVLMYQRLENNEI